MVYLIRFVVIVIEKELSGIYCDVRVNRLVNFVWLTQVTGDAL